MSRLSEFLKRIHILHPFTRDEQINAETEEALRAQKRAVEEAQSEFNLLHDKGIALRQIMQDARLRVASFAQFEQRIRDMSKNKEQERGH